MRMIPKRRRTLRPRFHMSPRLPPVMIIDSHCHAGKGDGLTGPWDTNANLDKYLRRASTAGIGRTVLLPAFHSNYSEANRRLAAIVARDRNRFYGYAMVHAERDAGRIATMVREAVEGYGFCGIKVHRHDARITREICEVARAYTLPVLYDVMGESSVIDQLVRHANIYTDSSGVRRFDFLVEAIRRAGPRKVLYGTDGPWLHPALELEKIHLLGLSQNDE